MNKQQYETAKRQSDNKRDQALTQVITEQEKLHIWEVNAIERRHLFDMYTNVIRRLPSR